MRWRGGRLTAPGARRAQARRQQHVVEHRQIGQQVELLEDDAHQVGAARVARAGRQARPVLPEQAHAAGARQQHPGHQAQQRALAAAAGPVDEDRASGLERQRVDGQAVTGRAWPGVAEVTDLEHEEIVLRAGRPRPQRGPGATAGCRPGGSKR
jgi:hypothetical protein